MSAQCKNGFKILILILLVRPFAWFFLGVNRYSKFKVPPDTPLILAVNHNSHLDTLLIFSLLPLKAAIRTRFVAAGDYFYEIPLLSWLLFDVFEMIPVWRNQHDVHSPTRRDSLALISEALHQGAVVVLFPEGTRGFPEQRSGLKKGIAKLVLRHPEIPVLPIYLRGLGKSLPRGEKVFVPLIPQIAAGTPLLWREASESQIMEDLAHSFSSLEKTLSTQDWIPA